MHVPLVVVPSGKRQTAGPCAHAGSVARARISAATSVRLLGDVRSTAIVMSARATVQTSGVRCTYSASATKQPSTSHASASGSMKVTWLHTTTGARARLAGRPRTRM